MSLDHHLLMLKAILAGEKYGLTTPEIMSLQEATHAVYEEIAFDLGDCSGEPNQRRWQTTDRANVIEASLDASRPLEMLRRTRKLTARLGELLEGHIIDYEDLKDIIGPAFMYEEYEIGSSSC